MACLFGHKWEGCKCTKCGKMRDEQHDWNGCRCRKCGRTRSEGHDYIYRQRRKNVLGQQKLWCEGECRLCGNTIDIEHDYQPTGKKCVLKCTRCGHTTEAHHFQPVPGRCADICSVCGEERDYTKIALNDTETIQNREAAILRLKEADMIPDELKRKCKKGDHLWKVSKENPQRFQGGASSTEYTCVLCGKKNVEVDWGD